MRKNKNENAIRDGGIFKIQYNLTKNKSSPQEDVEPIWATGARHDVPFATFLWGRCSAQSITMCDNVVE